MSEVSYFKTLAPDSKLLKMPDEPNKINLQTVLWLTGSQLVICPKICPGSGYRAVRWNHTEWLVLGVAVECCSCPSLNEVIATSLDGVGLGPASGSFLTETNSLKLNRN